MLSVQIMNLKPHSAVSEWLHRSQEIVLHIDFDVLHSDRYWIHVSMDENDFALGNLNKSMF